MALDASGPLSILGTMGKSARSMTEHLHARVTSLYETHREAIYRFLVAQGLPPAVAQEVTQDVFVKLFVALQRGTEVVSDQAWLYGVAGKSAVDYWRKEGRAMWVELEPDGDAETQFQSQVPTPEALAVQSQRLQRVADTMLKLPKEQRLCVVMRSKGLRYREIGQTLGVAPSTVSEWLSAAVEKLRGAAHD
jgi:RNA polymerase sigma factor (sigma-70 family)